MNLNQFRILALAAVAAASAFAQGRAIKADIPFDFDAGGKTMPAGRYVIRNTATPDALLLCAENSPISALVLSQHQADRLRRASPMLVFHRYGNSYFLSEIRAPGIMMRTMVPGRREREELARSSSSGGPTLATVALPE